MDRQHVAPKQYILIVDDDEQVDLRADLMVRSNFQVLYAKNVEEALHFAETIPDIKFGVLDVRLNDYGPYDGNETDHGKLAGLRLHRDLKALLPNARFLFKTSGGNFDEIRRRSEDIRRREEDEAKKKDVSRRIAREKIYEKTSLVSPFVVSGHVSTDQIEKLAEAVYSGQPPQPYIVIVHGHDKNAVAALKGLLSQRYGFEEVHVLRDLPDQGRTLIENFEYYARRADLVFALMTDDDRVAGKDEQAGNEQKRTERMRARQNVIFEIGYFCSALKRTSGRLILLEKRGIEVPSDMGGILTIDISEGVDTAETRERVDTALRAAGVVLNPWSRAERDRMTRSIS